MALAPLINATASKLRIVNFMVNLSLLEQIVKVFRFGCDRNGSRTRSSEAQEMALAKRMLL